MRRTDILNLLRKFRTEWKFLKAAKFNIRRYRAMKNYRYVLNLLTSPVWHFGVKGYEPIFSTVPLICGVTQSAMPVILPATARAAEGLMDETYRIMRYPVFEHCERPPMPLSAKPDSPKASSKAPTTGPPQQLQRRRREHRGGR